MISKSSECLLLLALLLMTMLLVRPGRAHDGAERDLARRSERLPRFGWSWWSGESETDRFNKGVVFMLYSRENPDEPEMIDIYEEDAPTLKHFDISRPTVVTSHGWLSDNQTFVGVREALLATTDVNYIAIKWSDCDSYFYPLSERHIPLVSDRVSLLLDFLHDKYAVPLESLHLIGHSLGAHIVGMAARNARSGTVGRITGLDPAGPLIPGNESQRLDRSDALFVDVIHTCANVLGWWDAIGHVDFYPNGGTCIQPGCMLTDLTQGTCSHGRSIVFLAESIYNRTAFMAFPCDGANGSPNKTDPGQPIVMGMDTPSDATGSYCLLTRNDSPFAMPEEEQLQRGVPGIVASVDDESANELRRGRRVPGNAVSARIYRSFLRRRQTMLRSEAPRRHHWGGF